MGVTIHYRGTLKDMDLLPDLEDRLVDLALQLGGRARIWRSASDDDPSRMVGGVIWDFAPGFDPVSLLVSPEGWLTPLMSIEEAEEGEMEERPWVFVKTQFGNPVSHVVLLKVLAVLQDRWFPDLEVIDEGGYWEDQDFGELLRRRGVITKAMDGLTEALEQYGLTEEAAESPEIVAARIERLAKMVHETMRRPSEHPPAEISEPEGWHPEDEMGGTEEEWDAFYQEQQRKLARLGRTCDELEAEGLDMYEAYIEALRREGFDPPELDEEEMEDPEPWTKDAEEWKGGVEARFADWPPLSRRAMELSTEARDILDGLPEESVSQIHGHLLEIGGGLAQALPASGAAGLELVQLKRAYRGAAFAFGSLHLVPKGEGRNRLRTQLLDIQAEIFDEMRRRSQILRERE